MRTRLILIAWLLVLTWLTSGRVRVFDSDASLWKDALLKAPTKPRPVMNYGRTQELAGDLTGAEAAYRTAIVLSFDQRRPPYMRLSTQAAAETNLAHLHIKAGRLASAMEVLEQTLAYWPIYPYARYNKGAIFWMVGACKEGAKEYDAALLLDPSLALPKEPCKSAPGYE